MSLRIALAVALASLTFACGARSQLDGFDPAEDGGGGSGGSPQKRPKSCEEQGVTYIYVVLDDKRIFAFDPPSATFSPRGSLACQDAQNAFSMAVNRKGIAFVEFTDGNIFRVQTKDGSCEGTAYVPDPSGSFTEFGMGFASDSDDADETLYLASRANELAKLNLETFERESVGMFSKFIGGAEVTGTGDGRLFAFGVDSSFQGSHLSEVDPKTAKVLSDRILPLGQGATDWAFANWGGDFYFFTADFNAGDVASAVRKYEPDAHRVTRVATAPGLIVGSGVSTCAPL